MAGHSRRVTNGSFPGQSEHDHNTSTTVVSCGAVDEWGFLLKGFVHVLRPEMSTHRRKGFLERLKHMDLKNSSIDNIQAI